MKIDWELVISFVIALALFAILDKVVISKITEKIGGSLEESLEVE